MDPASFAAAVGINVLSNFVYDLAARTFPGSRPSRIEAAIANTVEKFQQIEGLKQTLEEWLGSPGVLDESNRYAKGLKGYAPFGSTRSRWPWCGTHSSSCSTGPTPRHTR
jgi:hypothetical protein